MDADSVHTNGNDTPLEPRETPMSRAIEGYEPRTTVETTEVEVSPEPVLPVTTTRSALAEEMHHQQQNSAGIIILQWLTYAFWGWLILGLLWLMAVVLRNVILGEPSNDTVPYAVAASIVLFPLAFTCDFFYRKYEPAKKYGAAMIIMVVHAVLFAVLGIMSLIIAVFIGIDMLMNTVRSTDSQTVNLLVAAFAALLYVGAFLRTLNPFKAKRPTAIYAIAMTTLTAALLALVIAGPVVTSLATRDDRLIEVALPQVQQSIGEYISDNDKLPASLNDVSFTSDEARELVEDGKVEYKAVGKVEKIVLNNTTNENTTSTYRYELCVDYKATKNSENARRFTPDNGAYAVSLTTYAHGAGPTCYKLQQTVYPWSRN